MSEIFNLSTLCRCCHSDGCFKKLNLPYRSENAIEIYEIMLQEALGVKIIQPSLDQASYTICDNCIKRLRDASQFREQVLACEQKFKVYFTNEQFLNVGVQLENIKAEEESNDTDHFDMNMDIQLEDDNCLSQDNTAPLNDDCLRPNGCSKNSDVSKEGNTKSFKIIKTIEKGKEKLTIIPSGWEENGVLRWPERKIKKLMIKKGNSKPLPNWKKIDCIVMRTLINTYDEAKKELKVMLNPGDTSDNSDNDELITLNSVDNNNKVAFLTLPQNNIEDPLQDKGGKSTKYNPENNKFQKGAKDSIVLPIEIPVKDGEIPPDKIDKILENQTQILDNQKSILLNQDTIHETQKVIFEKNNQQTANLVDLIDERFTELVKLLGNPSLISNKFGETNPIEPHGFMIKPISNAEELNELENRLSDKAEAQKMQLQFSSMFNREDGIGISCAYKILDLMFTRNFLCQCSWSGGSKSDCVKIPLKTYKNILQFFFILIRSWDSTYTHDMNEKFFKMVLRNSLKRLANKNLRASTKRSRISGVSSKRSKTALMESEDIIIEKQAVGEEEIDQESENMEG